MRDIDLIVIHCAATPPDADIGVEEIRDWHVNGNGWSDVGYHYIVRRNGMIEGGRPVEEPGAHAKGHNANSIGVCLVGGVKADNTPDCNYTRAQWASLARLIRGLRASYADARILGHRDLPGVTKACPSFDAMAWAENA